jgi:hypothetical protein
MISSVLPGLRTLVLAAPILLSACATTSVISTPDKPVVLVTHYVCSGGVEVNVEQAGPRTAGQPMTIVYSDIRYPMHIAPSASGATYVNDANQLQWLVKGEEASLTHFGTGQILAMKCKSTPAKSN